MDPSLLLFLVLVVIGLAVFIQKMLDLMRRIGRVAPGLNSRRQFGVADPLYFQQSLFAPSYDPPQIPQQYDPFPDPSPISRPDVTQSTLQDAPASDSGNSYWSPDAAQFSRDAPAYDPGHPCVSPDTAQDYGPASSSDTGSSSSSSVCNSQ